MPNIRRLAYKDAFVWSLVQTMTGGSSVLPPVYFTEGVPTDFLVSFTLEEWTKVLSALYTGADLSYPDEAHEVVWSLVKQVEYPNVIPNGTFFDSFVQDWSQQSGNAILVTLDAAQWFGFRGLQSPPADLDSLLTDFVVLSAGDYKSRYLYMKNSNEGVAFITAVHSDGTVISVDTVDQYAAATTRNQISSASFTLTKSGSWRFRKRVNGKNASSSGFSSNFTRFTVQRLD